MTGRKPPVGDALGQQLEMLHTQLAQSAARLMVVHEASNLLRSTHDPEELSQGLLAGIADAVLAASGCVAGLAGDELRILATRGLEDHEAEALAADEQEAAVWFAVADGDEPQSRDELRATLDLAVIEAVDEDAEPWQAEEGSADADADRADLADDTVEGTEDWADAEDADPDTEGDDEDISCEELWSQHDDEDGDTADRDGEDDDADDHSAGEPLRSDPPAFELYVPLKVEDEVLGVLALGRRVDGQPYGGGDVQLARSLSSHLALALNHAALFAERAQHIEQLSSLLQISREITSSLDLDRVLHTIAHMLGMVLPNRRTVVALLSGRTVAIRASSDPEFKLSEATRDPILPLLEWARDARQTINTYREALDADEDADGRDLLLPWLSRDDGPRGVAILPLEDDQGILGLLVIETGEDAVPLDDEHEELITILANQTTVAIRNAELYQQVPMIGVLEPLLGRARRVRVAGRRRLLIRLGIVVAVLAVGFLVPLPAWVSGDAQLRPAAPVALRAAAAGTVEEVLVEEGQVVSKGTTVARLRRDELEVQLEQTRAQMQRTRAEGARARAQGDLSTYRARQAKLGELLGVEQFLLDELARTELRSPVDGIVLSPNVELRRGEHLERGETFAEVADLSRMDVEVAIADHDIASVTKGSAARLKIHAYPHRTFDGEVVRIAPRADAGGTFRVTVRLPNEDGALRPGMTGRARVEVPGRPVLARFFAPVVRRLRLGLWL